MNIWGISANSHDAAISVWHDKNLKFASHSERYSNIKNDGHLCNSLIQDAKYYGEPDLIVWYEDPKLKTLRQLQAGQGDKSIENNIEQYLSNFNLKKPIIYGQHHHSHAAAGYYTSKFSDATIIVIDSIGEFETLTVWEGKGNNLKKIYSQNYPNSVGLWFSAITQRCGLKPNEEEYILMGMAAYGDPNKYKMEIYNDFFEEINGPIIKFKKNLHKGCLDWRLDLLSDQNIYDIAAATQKIYEELLQGLSQWAKKNCTSNNLILMGGCALNCVANSIVTKDWDNVWIMPNPGDAGSAVGAVLGYFEEHAYWPGPYLGYNLGNNYPVDKTVEVLKSKKIAGVASGRAEYGPRALGHRSLLADPRGDNIKNLVNEIKRRQKFRPFAPAILEEYVDEYFEMPSNINSSPYMQFVAKCKKPTEFPAIIHADGTSRVQTVSKNDSPGFRKLLENWYQETGCPMLLNTSLNIKGMPMVNNLIDAELFSKKYNIDVLT
jgi:carbamoyltransferase